MPRHCSSLLLCMCMLCITIVLRTAMLIASARDAPGTLHGVGVSWNYLPYHYKHSTTGKADYAVNR